MFIQTQEAQRTPNRQDNRRKFPQHIIVKTLTIQNNNKKVQRKTQVTYKGKPIRIRVDFSMGTLKARKG